MQKTNPLLEIPIVVQFYKGSDGK
ncbi:hypothetical protein PCAR4_350190 [Paraburkholderia caribensis]|nr:hypothetical protein PCAR4_350190 [Paraburkholderia caribensis]